LDGVVVAPDDSLSLPFFNGDDINFCGDFVPFFCVDCNCDACREGENEKFNYFWDGVMCNG
jgi:hypothetical protein